MEQERKFLFDVNIFDAPPVEDVVEDELPPPPPPPTFSEEELAAAKDMAFEQGRQQGQKDERESREQQIATTLAEVADHFSHLFAAEQLRENIYEREALKLTLVALEQLFPTLNEKTGPGEIARVIEKTLIEHRKTKEILIIVPTGMKDDIEALIARLRENEQDEVRWRVLESATLPSGNCTLEWSDGGAVRDNEKTARAMRREIEALLGQTGISEIGQSDVILEHNTESGGAQDISGDPAPAAPSTAENDDE